MTSSAHTTESSIPLPDGSMYVKSWAPVSLKNPTPLILLHDSLGCVQAWRDFPEKLCERLGQPIIAYDRLGFGRSSARREPPSLRFIPEEAEIYFPHLLKALNIEKFSLYGYSVGGSMALVCAEKFKASCQSVITEASQAFVEERTRQGIRKAQLDFANPTVFAKLEKYHGPKTRWILDAWFDIWLSPEFSSWNIDQDVSKIDCPLMAIHGDLDEYGSEMFPQKIIELATGISKKVIIPSCKHNPHREQPELILDLIANWVPGPIAFTKASATQN